MLIIIIDRLGFVGIYTSVLIYYIYDVCTVWYEFVTLVVKICFGLLVIDWIYLSERKLDVDYIRFVWYGGIDICMIGPWSILR